MPLAQVLQAVAEGRNRTRHRATGGTQTSQAEPSGSDTNPCSCTTHNNQAGANTLCVIRHASTQLAHETLQRRGFGCLGAVLDPASHHHDKGETQHYFKLLTKY